jgi:5-methyltetrahydropteroyltriglutamate--homocysteine methyltransferase
VRHSTDRILVSHAGNLPRPDDVNTLLANKDIAGFSRRLPTAVNDIVDRQVELGVDIVNDGEYVKAGSYTGYMLERVTGWESLPITRPLAGKDGVDGFVAALGPLSLGGGQHNEYYPSEEAYMQAVAEAVHDEYKAITDAGLVVQIDEPNFATAWMFYPDYSVAEYRKLLEFYVEIINHALRGLPEDQVRFHVCWGSGHRPHVNDIEFKDIADLMLKINAQSYSVEAGNVRHAHEWQVWKDVKLPDGKILMPGVISHATDLVEHPDLVAERLINFASVVGKENLQTGTDCGIGSRVGHEEIVWAKLKTMSEGARRASHVLWGK